MDCGLGQEHHDDVHNGAVLNSSVVGFVKLNEGLSQQQGPSIRGTGRAKVSKKPKLLTNEGRIMSKGSKHSVLRKRTHKEIDSEVGTEVGCKKSRNAEIIELLEVAGSRPCRDQ